MWRKILLRRGLLTAANFRLRNAIGVARPVSVLVDTFGTAKVSEDKIAALVDKHFDLRPSAIIETLGLRRPIYKQTAAYGHMGREDIDLPWEKTDKAALLKQEAGL